MTPENPVWEPVQSVPVSAAEATQPDSGQATPDEQNDLMLAAFALFENGDSSFTIPRTGQQITISPAKMKQMPSIMRFFHRVVGALETSDLKKLVDIVSAEQRKLIAEGKTPAEIDIRSLVTGDVVDKAFGNVSIISLLGAAAFEHLPDFVPLFTNLNADEFGELEFDEGMLIAGGIFILNYGFFTQRLRPILMGFIRALASEYQKTGAAGMKKLALRTS